MRNKPDELTLARTFCLLQGAGEADPVEVIHHGARIWHDHSEGWKLDVALGKGLLAPLADHMLALRGSWCGSGIFVATRHLGNDNQDVLKNTEEV